MRLIYNPLAPSAMFIFMDSAGKRMTTAEGIKTLMAERHFSTGDVASICKCSTSTVYGWRQGKPPGLAPMLLLHCYLNSS